MLSTRKELAMQSLLCRHPQLWRCLSAGALLLLTLFPQQLAQADNRAVTAAPVALPGLIPAVVTVSGDGHIHEIALKGAWQDRDLTAAAGAPLSFSANVMAHRRSDGVSMVVYRGTDEHVHTIYLELRRVGSMWQELWHWADLTNITGAPLTGCDPYPFVRSDGISTVIYASGDGHVHELRLQDGWIGADLTSISGAPVANSCPIAYVRGDGINAIIYKSNNHIHELRLDNGWEVADLTLLSGAPDPMSGLSAYVRSDGISTINYAGIDGHIHDIRLQGTWIWSDLTAISGAPGTPNKPYGHVRSDGINAIVYATAGATPGHIYELYLDGDWKYYELTSVPNAVLGYSPVPYVRADGINAVVYRGTDGHYHEIRLQTAWQWADLTALSGAPTGGNPWPYNRSAVARVNLPLVLRP